MKRIKAIFAAIWEALSYPYTVQVELAELIAQHHMNAQKEYMREVEKRRRSKGFAACIIVALLCAPLFGQVSNPSVSTFTTLAASGVPVVVPPNGTIATGGVVTFGNALPVIIPQVWLYFPANAVVSGLGGLYYATCTSTTVCQVYTNYVNAATTPFTPSVPTSPVAAVGSNSAYTQTTGSALALTNTTLSAGAMGASGTVRRSAWLFYPTSANNKIFQVGFLGAYLVSVTTTTTLNDRLSIDFMNMGDAAHQSAWPALTGSYTAGSTAQAIGTTNTANAQSLVITCNLALATEFCGIMQYRDELMAAQ